MMEEEINSTVVIDIEELQKSLSLRNDLHHHSTSCFNFNAEGETSSSICKIQQLIRDAYKSDYEPVVVSIGPYHHGKPNLQEMEKIKWNFLEYILKSNPERTLHDYVDALWELYPIAKSYYAKDIKLQDKKLVHVLLLDGCFIIASICALEGSSKNPNSVSDENYDIPIDPLEFNLVMRDFLLVENQIPFFGVERIYELFSSKECDNALLIEKFSKFFQQGFHDTSFNAKIMKERLTDISHLLHLYHMYCQPSSNEEFHPRNISQPNQWHRALEYHIAGIKFTKRDSDEYNPHSLLDVSFIGDAMQIPYIFVDEGTTTIFRNLIALEQENPHFGNHISTYIAFISQLISTEQDVLLLVNKGIIGHHFENEEEVSNIFTSLNECVIFDFTGDYYLKDICRNLEAYYKSNMKWGLGWLRRAKSAIQVLV